MRLSIWLIALTVFVSTAFYLEVEMFEFMSMPITYFLIVAFFVCLIQDTKEIIK